jgi:hypothetical protein
MALGLGLRLNGRSRGVIVPRIITATISPALQPLTNAQTPADGWLASANQTANYASTAGTIATAVREVSINGGAFTTTLNQNLLPGDVVAGRVIVTDSAANTRTFNAGAILVSAVPVTFSSPATITGAPTVGQTLTVSATATGGVGAITLARQWRRNGTAISGATGATYLLVADDGLQSVDVVVTATDSEGTSATSTATAVSVALPPEFNVEEIDGELFVTAEGQLELIVTSPAHIAAYDAGDGAGRYLWTVNPTAPTILYPGEIGPTDPAAGSPVSLVHAPFVAFAGTLTLGNYEFIFDGLPSGETGTTLASAPAAGTVVALSYDATDANGTTPGVTNSVTTVGAWVISGSSIISSPTVAPPTVSGTSITG